MSAHRTHPSRRPAIAAGAAAALAFGLVGAVSASPAGATPRVSARVANDTLIVTGTSAADSITLRLAPGDPGTLQVDVGDDGSADHSFDRTTFSRIAVSTRSGDDRYRVDQANGIIDEPSTIAGGNGNDTLDGGDAVELFVGGSGNDAVDGNRANDTGVLGSGNDSFRWDPGDGSDVVEGQSGTDTLDFNGAAVDETMSLSRDGGRALFLRDIANIRMDTDGVERLDLTALGGVDRITIDDMTGTDFRRADVDLSGPAGGADGQPDVVTVDGTARADRVEVEAAGARVDVEGLQTETRITGSELADQLQLRTLAGNDDVDVDPAVSALIGVAVDLGTGQS